MQKRRREGGFTIIEMLVAITVTMLVMGAVVGLLSSGQTAFRREPEVADMQQNLRSAMDMIMRDVGMAGAGIPSEFVRAGTSAFHRRIRADLHAGPGQRRGLRGLDHHRLPAPAAARRSTGERTDDLALFTTNSDCGAEGVCGYLGSASHIRTDNNSSCVKTGDIPLFFMANGGWTIREVTATFDNNGGPGNCTQQEKHADISFTKGGSAAGLNPSGACARAASAPSPRRRRTATPCSCWAGAR